MSADDNGHDAARNSLLTLWTLMNMARTTPADNKEGWLRN